MMMNKKPDKLELKVQNLDKAQNKPPYGPNMPVPEGKVEVHIDDIIRGLKNKYDMKKTMTSELDSFIKIPPKYINELGVEGDEKIILKVFFDDMIMSMYVRDFEQGRTKPPLNFTKTSRNLVYGLYSLSMGGAASLAAHYLLNNPAATKTAYVLGAAAGLGWVHYGMKEAQEFTIGNPAYDARKKEELKKALNKEHFYISSKHVR